MIPEEVLADNPAILEKVVELSARRICRICLSEVDSLVEIDVAWKMKIVSCFPMVTVGSERLPKFICEPCGRFVKKSYEFRQLCKKSEQMLVNYPLTGSWTGELAIPRWLREEDQQEQVEVGKKRKFVEDLEVPKVGSVRVRSHESMAMSLQSPTITPGLVEQDDGRSQESLIESHPTVIRQLEQPTITPTTYQPKYQVPVIQSAIQPVSSQYSPSLLPYNNPSPQFRDPATNITPVNQPPQKIQRTNSIPPSLPQLILHPGYTMQQHTPQLVSQPQIQSCNTNLNNMVQMLSQLSSFPQTSVQQQFTLLNQRPPSNAQDQFMPTTPGYQLLPNTSIAIAPSNYQQPQIVMTPTGAQNSSVTSNYLQPVVAMTPTRVQNPATTPNYQQPQIAMTPTRVHNPTTTPIYQQPQISMTPTRAQNPQMNPNYQQPSTARTPTTVQNPATTPNYQQPQMAMTPTRGQNPQMTSNYQQPQIARTPTTVQNLATIPNYQQPQIAQTPTRSQNSSLTCLQLAVAMTPTTVQNPATTPNRQHPQLAQTTTTNQPSPAMTPTRNRPIAPTATGIWCHECNFRFLTVEHFKFHIRKHNPNPISRQTENLPRQLKTCRLCTARTFPTHEDLRRHLELHERVGLSKACDFCVKIFADEQHRNEHFRKHHADVLERTLKLNGQ